MNSTKGINIYFTTFKNYRIKTKVNIFKRNKNYGTSQWLVQDFPEVGPTFDFAKKSPKLHEIERIWTPGGDVLRAPP